TRAGEKLADDETGADGLAEADVVSEQRDRQTAAEGDEVGDLVRIGFQSIAPARLRFEVRRTFENDGIGQVPFEPGTVDVVVLRRRSGMEDFGLELRRRKGAPARVPRLRDRLRSSRLLGNSGNGH